jgi:similar to stage IV sporulation protein
MLLKLDELAWITVNVRGSSATVEVRERIPKPPVIDEGMPCNIIARKAGVVERMDTLAGKPAAQQGQTVDKGQLLVSGIVDVRRDGGYTGARFIRADARVTARTWYDVEGCLLTGASGKRYTGRNRTRNTLVVAGRRFPLYTDAAIPFDRYDIMVSGKNVVLGSGDTAVTFPVALVTEIYSEYVETELTLPSPTAEAQLRASLELRLQELLGSGELLSSETELTPSPTVLRGRLRAEAREEIAQRADVLTGMAIVEG